MRFTRFATTIISGAILASMVAGVASADAPTNDAFNQTWARTDKPVAQGQVSRTWMWGPEALTGEIVEPYAEAHNNGRTVQYFDKSRMEINHNIGVPAHSPWRVTNGLLALELITGRMQIGDNAFDERPPANIPVAGDLNSTITPTYATLAPLLTGETWPESTTITQMLAADGTVTIDPNLVMHGVIAQPTNAPTGHTIASIFWEFLTSEGIVYTDEGELARAALFSDPWYPTGYPITEAHWTRTTVNGTETVVLVQAFERRVLTYTPTNPAGWQVEAGNIGQHYYQWRHGDPQSQPGENAVVTTIETGPDTVEYFAKGNPRPGELDWGPSTLSVAPDGTYWLADSVASRLAHFNLAGERIGVIELADQYAQSIWDVDARTDTIWVSWANLDLGIYKLQGYAHSGELIHDIDLPESIYQDPGYLPHGVDVGDEGAVFLELDLGLRYVQVVDTQGAFNVRPVEGVPFGGHTYRQEWTGGVFDRMKVVVDGHDVPISADEGAFAVQVNLIPRPDEDSFFITRYSVFGDGTFHWNVEHRAIDGRLLGTTVASEDDRYAHVAYPYAVGPDGYVYKLTLYQHHLEIMRLGFATP